MCMVSIHILITAYETAYKYIFSLVPRPLPRREGPGDEGIYEYSCACMRPAVTGGHRKRFDTEKQGTLSLAVEHQKLGTGSLL